MIIPFDVLQSGIEIFLLVFVRMTGLFVIAPIFGRRNVPVYLKIGFAFFLAIILVSTASLKMPDYNATIIGFILVVFKEFMVGVVLGYVSYLIFTAIYIAGQIIDMQIGFGMVNVLDPVSNIQVPVTSNFYFIISMMVFLMFNGHHLLIKALFESYNNIPLGGALFSSELMNNVVRVFGDVFVIGFKISAPILIAILVTDVALGVISKAVPQFNVFVVGMPLKILIGLAVMIITVPAFVGFIEVLINGMNSEMLEFMKDMGPR